MPGISSGNKTEKTDEKSDVNVTILSDHCQENLLQKPCTGIAADTEHQAVNRRILIPTDDDAMIMMMIMTIIMMMDIPEEPTMSDMNQVVIAIQVVEEEIQAKKTIIAEAHEGPENQAIRHHENIIPGTDKDPDRRRPSTEDTSRSPAPDGQIQDQVLQDNHQLTIHVTNRATRRNRPLDVNIILHHTINNITKIHMPHTSRGICTTNQHSGTQINVGSSKQMAHGWT